MALENEDIKETVRDIIATDWDERDGRVVPTTDNVALADGAVSMEATMLYADLADSTSLAINVGGHIAAEVYKAYLACSSKIIRECGGEIRSFDGDRVMAVFLGKRPRTDAADCALKINWVFSKVIRPQFKKAYGEIEEAGVELNHGVGIDSSQVYIVRGGIFRDNDLVWVGKAPNVAAKLAALRHSPHNIIITDLVYNRLRDSAKLSSSGENMWEKFSDSSFGMLYQSSWRRPLS